MSRWSDRSPKRRLATSASTRGTTQTVRFGRTRRRRRNKRTRGQVEPLAALVAVFAVGVALSAYAGVVSDVLPTPDRNVADPTVERVHEAVTTAGVAVPERLPKAITAAPDGYRLNVTLTAAGRRWHAGPTPPSVDSDADSAARAMSVRIDPGRIRPGRLRVVAWS